MTGTWQPLLNQPTFNTSTMILLTDGRVMVQEEATPHWHALIPDNQGSYVNGTWSSLADMAFWRRYYASGMLKDGRVILIGGEQSGAGGDTNLGQIYDPVADQWDPLPSPPGWAQVGDAVCCVFPDGRFMIGALLSGECIIYDPETNAWSPGGAQPIRTNEETWTLQPDETILTVGCFPPYRSLKYSIASNVWRDEGAVPVTLVDPAMSEIGPAILLPDGRTICFGAADSGGSGKTAIYTPPTHPWQIGAWAAGPNIPNIGKTAIVCNDCPASLLPNGKVLIAAAPFKAGDWGSPIYFFEYDPYTNSFTQAPTPPNNGAQLYWSRFMLLPTGQVLFSPSSRDVRCYTPDGGPQDAWRPTITAVERECTSTITDDYLLKGTQLNGLSQANAYGDDDNSATNYPLVRLRSSKTGEIYYCRTYDFSTMGVATGSSIQSVRFSAAAAPYGHYELCVVANGISSHCESFCHRRPQGNCGCQDARCCCSKCCCGPCCKEESVIEPGIVRLRQELRELRGGVQKLASAVKIEEPAREPKEKRSDEEAGEGKSGKGEKSKGKRG